MRWENAEPTRTRESTRRSRKRRTKRTRKPVSVRAGQLEFFKVNTERWERRDAFHWLLALKWPRFAALILSVYVVINLIFARLSALRGPCVAQLTPGSFL